MKNWKESFIAVLVTCVVCTIAFVFSPKVHFVEASKLQMCLISLVPYVLFFLLGNIAISISKRKDQKIERLQSATQALTSLLQVSTSPKVDAISVDKAIDSLGIDWWNESGERILSKLFCTGFSDDSERARYILDFTAKAASSECSNFNALLPKIFSFLSSSDIAQILAMAYYLYAVNIVNGRVTYSTQNVVKAFKGTNKFSEYLMNEVFDFAKVIVDKNPDSTGRGQEILAIIKSEIARDKLS